MIVLQPTLSVGPSGHGQNQLVTVRPLIIRTATTSLTESRIREAVTPFSRSYIYIQTSVTFLISCFLTYDVTNRWDMHVF